MTLQRRLVAVMALLLVIGLVVADLVTYVSVRSFLYGRADDTLSQDDDQEERHDGHQPPLEGHPSRGRRRV